MKNLSICLLFLTSLCACEKSSLENPTLLSESGIDADTKALIEFAALESADPIIIDEPFDFYVDGDPFLEIPDSGSEGDESTGDVVSEGESPSSNDSGIDDETTPSGGEDLVDDHEDDGIHDDSGGHLCLRQRPIEPQHCVNKVGPKSKVLICHMPPGNPLNSHTLLVGAPAVKAHLAHGDTLGACKNLEEIYESCPKMKDSEDEVGTKHDERSSSKGHSNKTQGQSKNLK